MENFRKNYFENKNNSQKRKYIILVVLLIIVFLAVLNIINSSPSEMVRKLSNKPIITRHIAIGFWVNEFWDNTDSRIHPERLQKIEKEIGKKVAIANYYRGWKFLGDPTLPNELNSISNNGWIPMVSANPYIFADCPAGGMPLYKAIANGNCDALLSRIGKNLKLYNKPVFLRFAWEMNIPAIEWSINYTGSASEDFVNAWRRFHSIVKKEGANKVLWVFCPNIDTHNSTSVASIYPGDEFVDWIGLDGYNWGTTQSWSNWQDFSSIFLPSYNNILKISPNKPFMIGEVNTTDKGGDKAGWYRRMLKEEIPNTFTKVRAIIFFNEDKTSIEGVNWLIDANKESLEAFKGSIGDPIYRSSL